MGLLDALYGTPDKAQAMGLLGASMMAGNTPQGLLMANQHMAGAPQRQMEQKYRMMQMENLQAETEQRKLKAAQEQAQMERQARVRQAIPGLFNAAGMTGGQAMPQEVGGVPMFSKPMQAAPMQSTPGGFDVRRALELEMSPEQIAAYAGLGNIGRQEVARTVKGVGQDGREYEYQVDKFGQRVGDGMAQYRAPLQFSQGDRTTFADPYSLKPVGQFQTFQSPDSKASNAIAIRGQNMADARSRMTAEQGAIPSGYRRNMSGGLEFIPGGPADPNTARRAAPTEDERKAAGWLAQAQNGFTNMEKALAADPTASRPGMIESGSLPESLKNMTRSETRQQFNQGASSFAEAALRAATGAGVNEQEAKQKIAELTPQWGDKPGTIQQKREGLKVYLDSLAVRAGRAGVGGSPPDASGGNSDPLGLRK